VPRRKHRLDRWFQMHPRTTGAIAIAGLGAMTVWEIVRIAAARHTVPNGWAAGLAAGIAASLAMTSLLIITYRLIQRAPRRHGSLAMAVTLLIGVSPTLAFVFTAPQPGPASEVPYVVTTGASVAGMAYAGAFFALYLALVVRGTPRVIRSPPAASVETDRDLLTALVGPGETGWDVSWIGDGRRPRRLNAATLTEVTDQAAAAAVQHYLRRRAGATNADFQIALFPHDYNKGPIFDISGGLGAFVATDKFSGRTLHGASLEDLLQAAEESSDLRAGEYMFHWMRPVIALPQGSPLPG
jgi:hypothetical protein